jgi:choline dehydrogenase-like flavoprotein
MVASQLIAAGKTVAVVEAGADNVQNATQVREDETQLYLDTATRYAWSFFLPAAETGYEIAPGVPVVSPPMGQGLGRCMGGSSRHHFTFALRGSWEDYVEWWYSLDVSHTIVGLALFNGGAANPTVVNTVGDLTGVLSPGDWVRPRVPGGEQCDGWDEVFEISAINATTITLSNPNLASLPVGTQELLKLGKANPNLTGTTLAWPAGNGATGTLTCSTADGAFTSELSVGDWIVKNDADANNEIPYLVTAIADDNNCTIENAVVDPGLVGPATTAFPGGNGAGRVINAWNPSQLLRKYRDVVERDIDFGPNAAADRGFAAVPDPIQHGSDGLWVIGRIGGQARGDIRPNVVTPRISPIFEAWANALDIATGTAPIATYAADQNALAPGSAPTGGPLSGAADISKTPLAWIGTSQNNDLVAGGNQTGIVTWHDKYSERQTALKYVDSARSGGATIIGNAYVREIIWDNSGSRPRAVGVRYLTKDVNGLEEEKELYCTNEVILCGGAFGSPSILLRSKIGAAEKMADAGLTPIVCNKGVGANLREHIGTGQVWLPAVPISQFWNWNAYSARIRSNVDRAIKADNTAQVLAAPTTAPGATLTIGGTTLTPAGGARTPGNDDYDNTLLSVAAIADEIAAAINDAANSFAGSVTASSDGVDTVTTTAAVGGVAGNSITLVSGLPGEIAVGGATLTGGAEGPYAVGVPRQLFDDDYDIQYAAYTFTDGGRPLGSFLLNGYVDPTGAAQLGKASHRLPPGTPGTHTALVCALFNYKPRSFSSGMKLLSLDPTNPAAVELEPPNFQLGPANSTVSSGDAEAIANVQDVTIGALLADAGFGALLSVPVPIFAPGWSGSVVISPVADVVTFTELPSHFAGMCRLGTADDPKAAIDERARVFGVDGVRVADISIFPTMLRCNTMVPVLAHASLIADFILADNP